MSVARGHKQSSIMPHIETFYSLGPSIQFNLRSMTSDKETNFMTTQYKTKINFAQIIKNIDLKHQG